MESINITLMKQPQLCKVVDAVIFLGPRGAVWSLLHKNYCCLSLRFRHTGMFSAKLYDSGEAFRMLCEACSSPFTYIDI